MIRAGARDGHEPGVRLFPGGLIGHLAYVFLVASMVMSRMMWLRILALASFVAGVVYSAFILQDPVGTFWKCLLAAVNLVQLVRLRIAERRARLLPQEEALAARWFPGIARRVQRQVLDLGRWETLAAGTELARDGVAVPALVYLAEGSVTVSRGGTVLARRGAGALIGELSIASGGPAHGTAVLDTPARVWRVDADAVRRALETQPDQAAAFKGAFFAAVRAKLIEIDVPPVTGA